MELSVRDLCRMRLRAQSLDPIGDADAVSIVRALLAVQAQDFAQSLWAVGVRSRSVRRSDVLAAMDRGVLVRTLPMRGTLHLIPAEDLRWMLALTAERTIASLATRLRVLDLDAATLARAETVTRDALVGGRALDRAGFMELLAENGIAPDGQRGYHVILYLTQLALICWGPTSGTAQALVLVDEWIPPGPTPDRDEALQHFALRYFRGHGPATERDFAWWTKLTLTDVRAAIAGLGDRLTALTLDGTPHYVASDSPALEPASVRRGGLRALPGFDEYLLGYQDRSAALPAEHAERIVPGNNGIFLPTIVANGAVVGTWRRHPKSVRIVPEHFVDASPAALAAFDREAARYARFADG